MIFQNSSTQTYSGFQMSVYSFENKKSVPLRVLSFHFAVGKMKTAIPVLTGLQTRQITASDIFAWLKV
jgi:hypothetical protein